MEEYIKNQGQTIALNMLNHYYYDYDKPNVIIEVHCTPGGNLSQHQIKEWCDYYTNFWNGMHKSNEVVVAPTVCHSYGGFYIFFTKIRRDLALWINESRRNTGSYIHINDT